MATNKQRASAAAMLATAIAIPAEGLRRYAYYDPPGILTACYGHTGADVVKNKLYSLTECNKFLTDDMRNAIDTVERCAPGLPVEVLASFSDAVYNLGGIIACDKKNSTAARYLYAGQLIEACNQLPRWSKAKIMGFYVKLPGLVIRRNAERDLCLKGL